ncbi:hypothetical protein AB4Z18_05560 [Leifsonia sp. 2TAF2]|uniref:hypothetical protein n=1 Tax=Leifsonia sp. 2TAF2 TaxID=3233009 RepID=UPI003F9DC43A
MIIQPDNIEHLMMYGSSNEWLPLAGADAYASKFQSDPAQRRQLFLSAARSLVEAGYLHVGSLEHSDADDRGLGWARWSGSTDEHFRYLNDLCSIGDEYTGWVWACWFDLTETGQEILDGLPEPDDRFFE